MVFALLPRLVGDLRISALLFLVAWSIAWTVAGMRNARGTGSVLNADLSSLAILAAFFLASAGSALALLVLLDLWPDRALHLYVWCLMCALLASCLFLLQVTSKLFYEESD